MPTVRTTQKHEPIIRVFQELDAAEINLASTIREDFQAVWDRLFRLGESLVEAACKLDAEQKELMMQEYRRVQIMVAILHESELPAIMPDATYEDP